MRNFNARLDRIERDFPRPPCPLDREPQVALFGSEAEYLAWQNRPLPRCTCGRPHYFEVVILMEGDGGGN